MHDDERRVSKRYQISGGKVKYWQAQGPKSIVKLSDLSKNSVRFEMTKKLANGDMVDLEIIIPSIKAIKFDGRVVWTSMARESGALHQVRKLKNPNSPGLPRF